MAGGQPRTDRARRRGRLFVIGFVVVLAGVVAASLITNLTRMAARDAQAQSQPKAGPGAPAAAATEPLEIVSGDRRHRFAVEVMRTPESRARGLMFRRSMPEDAGMLFDFERDQLVAMWMKNTYLPLDMVFIFADGRIHRIEARTEPESERTISSGVAVRSVLEINAGVAAKLGLKPGDRVIHPMFR